MTHTSLRETPAIQMLFMHRRIVGKDLPPLIISVPTLAGRASKTPGIWGEREGGLAEETLDVAVSSEETRHYVTRRCRW